MDITLHHIEFTGETVAPTSKSAAHRLLIAAAFADGPSRMRLNGAGEDIAATVRCLSAMGADFCEETRDGLTWLYITPVTNPRDGVVADCGESGSTLRFFVPIVAALGTGARFGRRGRLPQRVMPHSSSPSTAA